MEKRRKFIYFIIVETIISIVFLSLCGYIVLYQNRYPINKNMYLLALILAFLFQSIACITYSDKMAEIYTKGSLGLYTLNSKQVKVIGIIMICIIIGLIFVM